MKAERCRDEDEWATNYRRFGIRVLKLHDADGGCFLTRWRLIDRDRFGLYLHHVSGPDPGLDLHDHPWPFGTLILRGSYLEDYATRSLAPDRRRWRVRGWGVGSFHWMPLGIAHRISVVKPGTWTLVVVGEKVRPWGFFLPSSGMDRGGWCDFREYDYPARRPSSRAR